MVKAVFGKENTSLRRADGMQCKEGVLPCKGAPLRRRGKGVLPCKAIPLRRRGAVLHEFPASPCTTKPLLHRPERRVASHTRCSRGFGSHAIRLRNSTRLQAGTRPAREGQRSNAPASAVQGGIFFSGNRLILLQPVIQGFQADTQCLCRQALVAAKVLQRCQNDFALRIS